MQHFTHTRIPTRAPFGTTSEGLFTDVFTLTTARGMKAKVTNYGATLTELHVPDRAGKAENVVLGFSVLKFYDHPMCPHFGGTIGRYANRIAYGEIHINGIQYKLTKNEDQKQTLHGGNRGFDRYVWDAALVESTEGPCVQFKRVSPDLEEGFPGTLTVLVTYTLLPDNALKIDYEATCDQPTVLNLTNHSYFNLAGAGQGDILDHELLIAAEHFTPVDDNKIPLGEVRSVKGTPLDFTTMRPIGERIQQIGGGYDHNYVFKPPAGSVGQGQPLRFVARLRDPKSGRRMEVQTTEPAMQLYTGNGLDGKINGMGGKYVRWGGVCFETQHFPDSPHQPKFPSTALRPGEKFASTTIFKFS
jgi:aldose 1-epimerase